jgi:hypothetical protein
MNHLGDTNATRASEDRVAFCPDLDLLREIGAKAFLFRRANCSEAIFTISFFRGKIRGLNFTRNLPATVARQSRIHRSPSRDDANFRGPLCLHTSP